MAPIKPTESVSADVDFDDTYAVPVDPAPADAAPAASDTPQHTRERDPADRATWKRDRAAALGIQRD